MERKEINSPMDDTHDHATCEKIPQRIGGDWMLNEKYSTETHAEKIAIEKC